MSAPQAEELVAVFKTLANDTRLRMLHALGRAGEMCVSEMADLLAMNPQAISNQLIRLADRGIVGVPAQWQQHLLPDCEPVRHRNPGPRPRSQ